MDRSSFPEQIPQHPASWEECIRLLDRLPECPMEERRNTIELLARNPSPWIRQRALRMGAALLPDAQLVGYLRNESDDVLRNAGLEILKLKGAKALPLALALLEDEDEDVVLQAILLLDGLKDLRALEPLRRMLIHDNPNVVQASLVAVGHLGDARVLPDLSRFLRADPWVQMAAIQALGDLRSPGAVRHLRPFLSDPMLGTLAAEALARIGGKSVFALLSGHWIRNRDLQDSETLLGLMAHVAEGLTSGASAVPFLSQALQGLLDDSSLAVRIFSARILLAAGIREEEDKALAVLGADSDPSGALPPCLSSRADLIPRFLQTEGIPYAWGLELAVRTRRRVSPQDLLNTLRNPSSRNHLEGLIRLLKLQKVVDLARPLLDLYLTLPPDQRARMVPVMLKIRPGLLSELNSRPDLDPGIRLMLTAVLKGGGRKMAKNLSRLPAPSLAEVLEQLAHRKSLLRALPWARLLADNPVDYAPLAAKAAVASGARELLPVLRDALPKAPLPEVVRALGELRDRDSVPALARLLKEDNPFLRALVLETLGHIGGLEARALLREAIAALHVSDLKMAFRALAQCADGEDSAVFREGAAHSDWMIRLACADALGRFPAPANIAVLTSLTSDPVPIVAQRAQAFLEQ